eukprot:Lithocolla_globosa_v1_NODE_4182_length_1492_cov_405.469729.p2 type:complete len:136 gc:universal NODE_4182_length_1492_cov_405.469729:1315-908(-)
MAATALTAASSRSSAEMMDIDAPSVRMISLASSTFVPAKRTIKGCLSPISLAALMIPLAIVSHFIIPPKMLTKIPLTLGSEVMILKASLTASSVAPPPTSRKLAGVPPLSLIMSIVAIAKPAPLTRQPISPSMAM